MQSSPHPSAMDGAEQAVAFAVSMLASSGPLHVREGKLHAGDFVVGSDFHIVDAVKSELGYGCTFFQGNLRIATTAIAAGTNHRALGTHANDVITQQVLRRGDRFRGLTRTLGKDWFIVYAPLRADDGQILGMVAAYRELFDFVDDLSSTDCAGEGVFTHTADGVITDISPAAFDMYSGPRSGLRSANLRDVLIDADVDLVEAFAEGAEYLAFEAHLRRSDGFVFPVEVTTSAVQTRRGPERLTIVRDFSKESRAREKLRQLNAQISRLAAVGQLAATVGHELRNPLAAIGMAVHFVSGRLRAHTEGPVDPQIMTFLELIERELDASGKIIENLLNYSRVREPKREPCALSGLVDEVLGLIRNAGDVVLVNHVSADSPAAQLDRHQFRQVLINLVQNAVEAMPDDQDAPQVEVTSTHGPDGWTLSVRDNGCGIPEASLDQIFQPLFSTKNTGTGLGLAVVAEIVRNHGGELQVRSVLDEGTVFTCAFASDVRM